MYRWIYTDIYNWHFCSGEFKSTADYQYQLLRCNVDLLKIIQLGLTFLDKNGNTPSDGISTWQFNFKFNLTEDMYAEESVELLRNSGIQFEKHEQVSFSIATVNLSNQSSIKNCILINITPKICFSILISGRHKPSKLCRNHDSFWLGADASSTVVIIFVWLWLWLPSQFIN